jgi:hypothetical protein
MATTLVTSPQTPVQVVRSIMTLCPGGPVGRVMAERGRVLLPRTMTITRVVIERRARGLPMGRIVVGLAPAASGSVLTISAGGHPGALVVSIALVAAMASVVALVAGGAAAAVAGAIVGAIEAVRWRTALAAVNEDGEWLATRLLQR